MTYDQTHSPADANSLAPTPTDFAVIVVLSLLTRLICSLAGMHLMHLTAPQYAIHLGDGYSYLNYARYLVGQRQGVEAFDLRLFPGTPMLIALLYRIGVPLTAAGLGLTLVSSAVANALGAAVAKDRRVGWAMVALTPDWLISGSSVASEAPLLAFTLLGLWLVLRKHQSWLATTCGGLLLGFAGTIRPVACFAVIGYLLYAARFRLWRHAVVVATTSAAVVGAAMLFMHFRMGDALHGVKIYARDSNAYGGQLLWFPGRSLLTTPFWYPVPRIKIVLVWGEALVLLFTCVVAVRNYRRRDADRFDLLSMPWLIGNTLFLLCVGNHWGFNIFKRLTLPALPAELGTLRRWNPRWLPYAWPLVGAASMAVAIVLIVRH